LVDVRDRTSEPLLKKALLMCDWAPTDDPWSAARGVKNAKKRAPASDAATDMLITPSEPCARTGHDQRLGTVIIHA